MRIWKIELAALALGVALGGSALAQQTQPQTERQQPQQRPGQAAESGMAEKKMQGNLAKASKMIDKELKGPGNEQIGTIEDLIIDTQHDRAAYAVVSLAGVADQNVRVIPFKALHPSATGEGAQTVLSKEKIQQSQAYTEASLPDLKDPSWQQRAHQSLNLEPYWQSAGQVGARPEARPGAAEQPGAAGAGAQQAMTTKGPGELRRFSEMRNQSIQNDEREQLGRLQDLVIDVPQAYVAYGVISMQPAAGAAGAAGAEAGAQGGKLVAVPFSAFEAQEGQESLSLDASQQQLQQLSFDANNWPNLSDRQVATRLHRTFNQTPYWETLGYPAPGSESGASGAQQRSGAAGEAQPQSGASGEAQPRNGGASSTPGAGAGAGASQQPGASGGAR